MSDELQTPTSAIETTPTEVPTDFHVEVGKVTNVIKHPNADTLSIGDCCGAPVIFQTGCYNEGDLAVYVPVDAVVPAGDPRWEFLGDHRRIKAKRLRGIYSQGILTPADPSWAIGFDARAILNIEKYEPALPAHYGTSGENLPDPGFLPIYGVESQRRFRDVIEEGEEVVYTEKIHGANARYIFVEKLWCASHYNYKKEDPNDQWWAAAIKYDLAGKLATIPGIGLFAEVFGQVQDLRYGAKQGELFLRFYDAYDSKTKRWYDYEELVALVTGLGLDMVPELYRGPWSPARAAAAAEGPSTVPGANHMREGTVVKPVVNRYERTLGRVNLKIVGQGYLLRKVKDEKPAPKVAIEVPDAVQDDALEV
jgi:RNA ligase (TIGR02306 family)